MFTYYDPFFIHKTLKKNSENGRLEKMQYTHYIQSYALAALILNASLEIVPTLKISEGAKMAINATVILTLVAIVSARLRAEALNKTNLRLDNNATRIEKYTTIGYELAIGLALQIPYIALDIIKSKITDKTAHNALQYAFFTCIAGALALCIVAPYLPKTTGQNQAALLDEAPHPKQENETLKFFLLDIVRLTFVILPCSALQSVFEKNSLEFLISFGLLTLVLLQKDLKAAYIVYREMFNDRWGDIFVIEPPPVTDIENPAGSAAAITRERERNGIANPSIDSGSLPGLGDLYGAEERLSA